jgi:nicotinamide-nucleotide amidase
MSIEIVAIGNEVLSGMITNTNASYLSDRLEHEGWKVGRHTVLPDDPGTITLGLQEALDRSMCVIATGGLGPTIDDITLPCAENIFDSEPKEIPNKVGSASGLLFEADDKTLILLPGVPFEMQPMFEDHIVPFLHRTFPIEKKRYHRVVHLCLVREQDIDPLVRELKSAYPKIDFGIYPGYGILTVKLRSYDLASLEKAEQRVIHQFKAHFFPAKSGKIEESIHDWFTTHKKTLACAESCTGGLIASKITALAGASNYFLGSLVTYSNGLKEHLLGVSPETLKSQGAVSAEAVQEMVHGLLKATGADWGIAVSGIAGPTGSTPDKPVGTIWYALGQKGKKPLVGTFLAKGNRQTIILQTANKVMGLLWQTLMA